MSIYISLAFVVTTLITFWLFWKSVGYNKRVFWLFVIWLLLHGVLAFTGFYQNLEINPPRIIFIFPLTILLIGALFSSKKGKEWISKLDVKLLTLLHVVRIPVELILYFLFINGAIPELMTFTGRNFDVLAGITATIVYYFGFVKNILGKKAILIWNLLCMGLLLNIVVNAILASPLPFQQFAFDQPNIAVLYFPFVWLPAFVVPVVLFSHLAVLRNTIIKL